ncbi:MAG TPA: LPS-assembly protein LptD, partial [Hydrogenophaga sp.]
DRSLAVANLSRRWQAPGWFVQPAAQLHMAQYQTTGLNGQQDTSASRVVPTLSVDSGLVFERPAQFFGRDYIQTLEPRAFFTWTPFRDQSALPNYDSGSRDFNLATMFSTNAFNGNDRIADMKAVTVGLNSRLLDPGTGSEVVRLGLAQRYLLADQNVTLPGGAPVTERASDMLLAARVQWDPLWSFDSTVQYNPKSKQSARTTVGGRYTPGPYRVFSAAYRIQRGVSEQLDLGWQWPLSALWGGATELKRGRALGPNQWYSVGRINYSLPDRKILDLVAGFEYDAGCWLGRVVLERLQTSTTKANQRLLLQLEFDGLSRLGASSLQSLQANIPRYRYLREEVSPPSRFPQYD